MNTDFLHLHAQPWEHSDAYIVGTRQELMRLFAAAGVAVQQGHSTLTTFAQDGEGYTLHVLCVDGDATVQHALPYTDECAADKRENAVWPGKLVPHPPRCPCARCTLGRLKTINDPAVHEMVMGLRGNDKEETR